MIIIALLTLIKSDYNSFVRNDRVIIIVLLEMMKSEYNSFVRNDDE